MLGETIFFLEASYPVQAGSQTVDSSHVVLPEFVQDQTCLHGSSFRA